MQVGRSICSCIPDTHPHRIISTSVAKTQLFLMMMGHSHPKHVEIDEYTKNKLCTKLVLFIRFYRDAWSTKHKKCNYTHVGHSSRVEKRSNYVSKRHEIPDGYIMGICLHCTMTIGRTCLEISAKTTVDLVNLLTHEFRNDSAKRRYS